MMVLMSVQRSLENYHSETDVDVLRTKSLQVLLEKTG